MTSAKSDNTLEIGIEGGYHTGLGYFREFDRDSGKFINSDEVEFMAGSLPINVIHNTFTQESSIRFGAGLKGGLGFGIDTEFYLKINPKPVVSFTPYEQKVLNNK